MSVYFLNVLPQPPDIMGMCVLTGALRYCLTRVSTLSAGWVIWLIGVLFSGVMIALLLDLWRRFGKLTQAIRRVHFPRSLDSFHEVLS
jgi:hypothetical protein